MILILGKIGFAFALFFLGASMYDVRKILGFFYPPPLVTVANQLNLFLLSAFWGAPSPHPLLTSYMEDPLWN